MQVNMSHVPKQARRGVARSVVWHAHLGPVHATTSRRHARRRAGIAGGLALAARARYRFGRRRLGGDGEGAVREARLAVTLIALESIDSSTIGSSAGAGLTTLPPQPSLLT